MKKQYEQLKKKKMYLPSDNSSSNSASFSRTSSGNRVTSTLSSAIAVVAPAVSTILIFEYHNECDKGGRPNTGADDIG